STRSTSGSSSTPATPPSTSNSEPLMYAINLCAFAALREVLCLSAIVRQALQAVIPAPHPPVLRQYFLQRFPMWPDDVQRRQRPRPRPVRLSCPERTQPALG